MSTSAVQAAAFYREAVRAGSVRAIRDDGGFPAALGDGAHQAMPCWSLHRFG